jgi:hypothetical protein
MNHFNPDQKDASGRPQIASHYTPLTGPYDSSDPDLLEYQALLMKIAGIDGVIVDWYSMVDFRDYGLLNASTARLFEVMKKARLHFAICYEDQAVKHMVEDKKLAEEDIFTHAQDVMRYLQSTWFSDPTYIKFSGRPVLLIFGPQYFTDPANWQVIFSALYPQPLFITLDHPVGSVSVGSYPWPPMGLSKDGVLSQAALESYLKAFYSKSQGWE